MPARKTEKSEVVTTDDIRIEPTKQEAGYTRLKSPLGSETTVPDSIVEILLDSGYTEA